MPPPALPLLPAHLKARLRAMSVDDAAAWSGYLSLPGVIEHTSWGDISSESLQRQIASYGAGQRALRWAIVDGDDRLMGTVGLNDIAPGHDRAELAYDLSPAFQGRGLATAAARAVTAWAHTTLGCARVQATVLDSNLASIAVLERIGMQREGQLAAHRHVRGQPRDFWLYASLRPPRCHDDPT